MDIGSGEMGFDRGNAHLHQIRLVEIKRVAEGDETTVGAYEYDGLGRKIVAALTNTGEPAKPRDGGAQIEHYYYNGRKMAEIRDGDNLTTRQFVDGPGGDCIFVDFNGDPKNHADCDPDNAAPDSGDELPDKRYFYHADRTGKITSLTGYGDDAGVIIERRTKAYNASIILLGVDPNGNEHGGTGEVSDIGDTTDNCGGGDEGISPDDTDGGGGPPTCDEIEELFGPCPPGSHYVQDAASGFCSCARGGGGGGGGCGPLCGGGPPPGGGPIGPPGGGPIGPPVGGPPIGPPIDPPVGPPIGPPNPDPKPQPDKIELLEVGFSEVLFGAVGDGSCCQRYREEYHEEKGTYPEQTAGVATTICCDGKVVHCLWRRGRVTMLLPSDGYARQLAETCLLAHECTHADDIKECPSSGVSSDWKYEDPNQELREECKGQKAAMECLKNARAKCSAGSTNVKQCESDLRTQFNGANEAYRAFGCNSFTFEPDELHCNDGSDLITDPPIIPWFGGS